MITELEGIIRRKDKQYTELKKYWDSFVEMLENVNSHPGLSSHSTSKHSDNTYLFSVFGLTFYVRFSHEFTKGCLEYGRIEEHILGNLELQIMKTIRFDRLGNFLDEYDTYSVSDYERVHIEMIKGVHFSIPSCDDEEKASN